VFCLSVVVGRFPDNETFCNFGSKSDPEGCTGVWSP
jgi:hypothetical protein